jgi:hypothetical protein
MVDFKVRHPGVMNYPDIGDIMFGKWGRNLLAFGLAAKVSREHALRWPSWSLMRVG